MKKKIKALFSAYNANLITLGGLIAELEKIHSETVLKQFADKLDSWESSQQENHNV